MDGKTADEDSKDQRWSQAYSGPKIERRVEVRERQWVPQQDGPLGAIRK